MIRRLLPLLLLGVLAGPAGAEGGVVIGRHVRVRGDVPAAWLEEAAALGDALVERLRVDLGRMPPRDALPLELVLHPDRASFEAAVPAVRPREGEPPEPLGGWTSWDPCVSHVARQADDFDTRRLILHELVHQFDGRSRAATRRGRGVAWYREGLAEFYGWHRRTRAGLVFGAFDAVTRNDRLATVKARVADPDWSAYEIGRAARTPTYDDAIALVGALRGTQDEPLRSRFATLERDILERGGGAEAFERLFGPLRAELDAAVRAWWKMQHPRWVLEGRTWDETPTGLHVRPTGRALARPAAETAPWRRLAFVLELEAQTTEAGLLLRSPDAPARWEVLLRLRLDGVALLVDGAEVATHALPPATRRIVEVIRGEEGLRVHVRAGRTGPAAPPGRVEMRVPYARVCAPALLDRLQPWLFAEGGAASFSGLQSSRR